MGTYTTIAKVKARFEDYDTSLSDANIEEFINTAEGIIDVIMKKTARGSKKDFNFDSAKHGIIEDTASTMAAFNCLNAQPTGQTGTITSAKASLIGDFLWATFKRNILYLSDSRTVNYLVGL